MPWDEPTPATANLKFVDDGRCNPTVILDKAFSHLMHLGTQTLVLQMQGGEEKIFFQACKNKYFKIFFLELDIISLFFHIKNNTIIIRLWKQSALKLWAPTLLFAIITTV